MYNPVPLALKAVTALCVTFALDCAMAAQTSSQTQRETSAYPTRPVRIVVPFAPGGPTDLLARLLGAKMSERWAQPVIVDNRPGASGNIGIGLVAQAAPDGHTMLLSLHAVIINPSLYPKLPWHPLRDLIPITNTATSPNIAIASLNVPAKTLKDLVALAKAAPGKYTFGSPGHATSSHLTMERFRLASGIDVSHVAYKGAAPVVNAVIGSEVPAAFLSAPGIATQMVQSGRVRGLATTGKRRTAVLPDVPTLIESGYNFSAEGMNGLFVPARTRESIVERIHAEVLSALGDADVRARIVAAGFEPVGNSRSEFAAYVKDEIAAWTRVIRETGIKPSE
jgi:tripartite-type tricarboxylate transporter receptor subunit TctC